MFLTGDGVIEARTHMIHAGIGLSLSSDTARALADATTSALDTLRSEPAFALVAATLPHFDDLPRFEAALRTSFGSRLPVAGSSTEAVGVVDPRQGPVAQVHRGTAVAVLLAGGSVEAASFAVDGTEMAAASPASPDEGNARPSENRTSDTRTPDDFDRTGTSAVHTAVESLNAPIASFLFFADPRSPGIPQIGAITARAAPDAMVAGGGSTGGGGELFQIGGGRVVTNGFAGLAIARHWTRVAVSVSQGGQLLSRRGTITRAEPHRILEIDGRPATELLDSLRSEDLPVSPEQVAPLLALAVAPAGKEALDHGHFMVRELDGVDPQRRTLGVQSLVERGWGVGLILREAIAARAEVRRNAGFLRDAFDGTAPGLGVYFDCLSRGEALYGVDGVDLGEIGRRIGDVPVLGLTTSFEIGPLWLGDGGMTPTALHRHAGLLWALATDPSAPAARRRRRRSAGDSAGGLTGGSTETNAAPGAAEG